MAASTCKAFAVFPLEASISVWPRLVMPGRSSRIMPQAIRSFTDPKGLQNSSLAYSSTPSMPCLRGSSLSSGVFPISSVMSE